MTTWIHTLMRAIEYGGIAIIALGVALATIEFARRLPRDGFDAHYRQYRRRIGQAILLGLEWLVAADIIGTVAVEPSLRNIGVLALIVLVRTFLSMALEVEMEGRLPWKRAE